MKPLVISCSLNPGSRSAILARHAHQALPDAGFVDLRESPLPMCDGGAAYHHENVAPLARQITDAAPILLAAPIYNYDVNAAAKNLIEMTGRAWTGKVVGFICAAGGQGSYMSVMTLANSLMLDYRCLIVPRFVYATDEHFAADGSAGDEVLVRVRELCQAATGLADAMQRVNIG